ncbi:hypothetical protein SAMN05421743_111135 [Thalassobacillus cyri]|uniref:LysM domain-containing protein n=1 Tax=Thalassobacillus cyri TaxID=571932 RepID=A0A1H4FIB8_9BACI|nr:hypothetical protein [Thalassobacillus cyri]SEA97089.1 hypothetical protein SAMN05421743_111135 [Thalassobacillus cyri]
MKKLGLFILMILLLVSLYKDLTIGTTINRSESDHKVNTIENPPPPQGDILEPPLRYNQKVPVKVKAGDTVLSIMEQLHNGEYYHSMNTMIEDFQQLNPGIDPSSLTIEKVYYFPLYEKDQLE